MSAQTKDGGPAFPIPIAGCNDGSVYNTMEQSAGKLGGMSLRDYFAAKAMQGIVSSIDSEDNYWRIRHLAINQGCRNVSEWIARDSYKQADAMLRASELAP